MGTTTSCGWYTCAWYEARNMSSFWQWVRVKGTNFAWMHFTVWRNWDQSFEKPEGSMKATYCQMRPPQLYIQTTVAALYTTCSKGLHHSPDHNFLLCWNVSYQPHIVSALIDIHHHLYPLAIHTVSFTLYGKKVVTWTVLYLQTGATPLYLACQEGHLPVVKRLIAAKAKVNHQTKVHPMYLIAVSSTIT